MFPPKSPQANPLETPLELGDPNLYRIIGLASILPLPNGIFGRPMRACPPKRKWLFATLQRYNVKHKHNQGKRVANGIACSKEGGNAMSPLHSRGSPNKRGQNQKSKPPLRVTMMPLGAPSISKYGSLVRPNSCTALEAPPIYTSGVKFAHQLALPSAKVHPGGRVQVKIFFCVFIQFGILHKILSILSVAT